MSGWPKRFEDMVVARLPGRRGDEALDPDEPLSGYGLDSLGIVNLITDLEQEFAFSFPEADVSPATFYSLGSLWTVVARHAARTSV